MSCSKKHSSKTNAGRLRYHTLMVMLAMQSGNWHAEFSLDASELVGAELPDAEKSDTTSRPTRFFIIRVQIHTTQQLLGVTRSLKSSMKFRSRRCPRVWFRGVRAKYSFPWTFALRISQNLHGNPETVWNR